MLVKSDGVDHSVWITLCGCAVEVRKGIPQLDGQHQGRLEREGTVV